MNKICDHYMGDSMVIRVYNNPWGHVSVESVSSVFVTKPVKVILYHAYGSIINLSQEFLGGEEGELLRLFNPVLNDESFDMFEVLDVVCDHCQPLGLCSTANEEVKVFDFLACVPKADSLSGEDIQRFTK